MARYGREYGFDPGGRRDRPREGYREMGEIRTDPRGWAPWGKPFGGRTGGGWMGRQGPPWGRGGYEGGGRERGGGGPGGRFDPGMEHYYSGTFHGRGPIGESSHRGGTTRAPERGGRNPMRWGRGGW